MQTGVTYTSGCMDQKLVSGKNLQCYFQFGSTFPVDRMNEVSSSTDAKLKPWYTDKIWVRIRNKDTRITIGDFLEKYMEHENCVSCLKAFFTFINDFLIELLVTVTINIFKDIESLFNIIHERFRACSHVHGEKFCRHLHSFVLNKVLDFLERFRDKMPTDFAESFGEKYHYLVFTWRFHECLHG